MASLKNASAASVSPTRISRIPTQAVLGIKTLGRRVRRLRACWNFWLSSKNSLRIKRLKYAIGWLPAAWVGLFCNFIAFGRGPEFSRAKPRKALGVIGRGVAWFPEILFGQAAAA